MDVTFRSAVPEDAKAATKLLTAAFPHLPVTPRQIRERLFETDPASTTRHIAGFAADRLIAWERVAYDQATNSALVIVVVDPDFRHQGVGTHLLNDATEHAQRIGAFTMNSPAIEDADIRRFSAKRGWIPMHWQHYHSLDIRSLTAMNPPKAPSGTQLIAGWALEDPKLLHLVYNECLQDAAPPGATPQLLGYDDWLNAVWRGSSSFDSIESALVMSHGYPIAFAMFDMDPRSGRIWSSMTGTRRGWRNQGLAKLAKLSMLHRASERGINTAWAVFQNDNSRITAVNASLGYAPTITQVTLVKHLKDF